MVVFAAPFAPLSSSADGALAVGVPPDVVQQGFAYGINVNSPDEDTARQRAIQNCQSTIEALDCKATAGPDRIEFYEKSSSGCDGQ